MFSLSKVKVKADRQLQIVASTHHGTATVSCLFEVQNMEFWRAREALQRHQQPRLQRPLWEALLLGSAQLLLQPEPS